MSDKSVRPALRQTHTFAILEISDAAYEEIAEKLKVASYDHVFIQVNGHGLAMDMAGIALAKKGE